MTSSLAGSEVGLLSLFRGPERGLLGALGLSTLIAPVTYLILGRRRKWRVIGVIPVVSASLALIALGTRLVRPDLVSPYLRVGAAVTVPFELLLMGWILYTATKTVRAFGRQGAQADFHERILAAVRGAAGPGRFAEFLAGEISALYYGLFSWGARPSEPAGQTAVAYQRSAGYGVALPALVALVALETTLLHALLAGVAPRLAWIVTVLSLYAIVWLIADHRASRLRPMLLDDQRLVVKAGLRWTVAIPLADICAVSAVPEEPGEADLRGVKRLTLFGRPQLRVDLRQSVTLQGPFGLSRRANRVAISVDDWPAFRDALRRAKVVVEGEARASSQDLFERLSEGLRGVLKSASVADLLARELSLLAYAFFFWGLSPKVPPGGQAFTIHRKSNYAAFVGVIIGVSLVEMAAVHLMLGKVSATAANILMALGGYGIIWFFGDVQALRLRPIVVDGEMLRVRVGLRREANIPLADVERIETLPATGEPERRSGSYLRCTALGAPELLLRLRRPVVFGQMIGRKRTVSVVGLLLDDEPAFRGLMARMK